MINTLPIVFLPGLLSDKRIWQHQVDRLSSLYPVHIHELFHGNVAQQIIESILDKAPERFVLVGHSMGGWIALELMKIAPERVQKLCLINTTAKLDSDKKRAARLQMLELVEKGEFHKVTNALSEAMVFNNEVITKVKEMMNEVGEKIFVSQQQAMLVREDCRQILPAIKCPTLVVHSTQDKIFNLEDHLELSSEIPAAKLAIIDDCGHMTSLERPQALTTLLRFWLENF